MTRTAALATLSVALVALTAGEALAQWKPNRPIEFIATAGPGGGTDNLARTVQAIVTKYKLTEQPIVVVNKGGGSGAEGYIYGKSMAGDPHKVIYGTSNVRPSPAASATSRILMSNVPPPRS